MCKRYVGCLSGPGEELGVGENDDLVERNDGREGQGGGAILQVSRALIAGLAWLAFWLCFLSVLFCTCLCVSATAAVGRVCGCKCMDVWMYGWVDGRLGLV